jgi:hypothetical protein
MAHSDLRMRQLRSRLRDDRSGRVAFVAHCLLNENVRYLGGACRPGDVSEVVDGLQRQGVGICQMPCPEQDAWGGVLKRRLLAMYTGAARSGRASGGGITPTRRPAARLLNRPTTTHLLGLLHPASLIVNSLLPRRSSEGSARCSRTRLPATSWCCGHGGRRTGSLRSAPLGYVVLDGAIYCGPPCQPSESTVCIG